MTPERVLALDVGRARVGVAISDPLGLTAQPLEVIDRRKGGAFDRIAALITEREVAQVVIGRPLTLSGKEAQAVAAIDGFAEKLAAKIQVPIRMWDERLTTAQAEKAMIAQGARRKTRRDNIDKIAAALILQSFLDAGCPAEDLP